MVVIEEDEYYDLDDQNYEYNDKNRINPYTGKPAKFHMDKFFGKDMEPKILTEEEIKNVMKNIAINEQEFNRNIEAIPLIQSRPSLFSDHESIAYAMRAAEVAEEKMKEFDKLSKKKRKDRLKLFDNCLKEYLNVECNSNYKIKYDK